MRYFALSFWLMKFDLLTKRHAETAFYNNKKRDIQIIPNKLSITIVKNRGAAYNILQNNKFILDILSVVVLLLSLYDLIKKNKSNSSAVSKTAAAFLLGGGLGNIYERIVKKQVTDFIYFKGSPVFNFADVFVAIGTLMKILNFKEEM